MWFFLYNEPSSWEEPINMFYRTCEWRNDFSVVRHNTTFSLCHTELWTANSSSTFISLAFKTFTPVMVDKLFQRKPVMVDRKIKAIRTQRQSAFAFLSPSWNPMSTIYQRLEGLVKLILHLFSTFTAPWPWQVHHIHVFEQSKAQTLTFAFSSSGGTKLITNSLSQTKYIWVNSGITTSSSLCDIAE